MLSERTAKWIVGVVGIATLALIVSALAAEAQVDTARQKAVRVYTDSIRKETCRNGRLSASGLTCTSTGTNPAPRVTYLRRHANAIDSILRLPPVIVQPPANQKPHAAFTISWSGTTATLDASSSTDDKAVVRSEFRAPGTDRPPKTGPVATRGWGSGDAVYTEWLYVWDAEGLVDSTSHQIVGPPGGTVPPPIDTTTPPPVVTPPPTGIAAPEMPRLVPPSSDPYPGRACSVTVLPSAGAANSAFRAARGGQVVCLQGGGDFGALTLPARAAGDTGWIVVRSTNYSLPAEGTRMRPSIASGLAKITTSLNGSPALTTTPGTFGWVIRGVEITPAINVNLTYALVQLGDVGLMQNTYAQVPQRLIFSQVYIHGSTLGEMQRCVALQSGATAIVDSWISECHGRGYDSQAIGGWNGPGPHLVRNSYLEGAGENVMWGGATPSIPGMVASDITFVRNHVATPITWKGVWTRKNLLETKNAVRVSIDSSVFDGSWLDAQTGEALLFKSINDQGTCNWCRTSDVTVRRSLIRHTGRGLTFSGRENYNAIGSVDSTARRFLIQDVVVDSINVAPYTGAARGIQIGSGASDIVFERVLVAGRPDDGTQLVLDGNTPSPRVAFRQSVLNHGYYFASNSVSVIGLPAMTASLPGFQWSAMTVIRGAQLNALPPGTTIATSEPALAAQVRATVTTAIAGVVVPP